MNTLEPIVINTSEISLTMSCEDICEALRFCAIEKKCTRCPLFSITDCEAVLMPAVFEMVNRQKAEIEALKLINSTYCAEAETIREIAIKEFSVRLKGMSEYGTINVSPWQVDNLVKEMTEGEDESIS